MIPFLESLEVILWEGIATYVILLLGLYLFFRSRAYPLRRFFPTIALFFSHLRKKKQSSQGEHPLKLFFASLGGCIGIGNLVTVCGAIHLGGPGVLFWMWVVGLLGVLIKYGEVYLGMKYRRPKKDNSGFSGGPMYFLQRAFRSPWFARCMALLLCIYGVEIFMFNTIRDSFVENSPLSHGTITLILLSLIFFGGMRGVRQLGTISSHLVPLFIVLFCSSVFWVLAHHLWELPSLFCLIFRSAFTGHAAVGGFLGSSVSFALYRGFQVGCYSADIGMGYASILHSESCEKDPEKQASLALLDIFLDTYVVATAAGLLVLVTGVWKEPMDASLFVQRALEPYLPLTSFFMPLFLFLVGYTTIISYLHTGKKCAQFLFPRWGKPLFIFYAFTAFLLFSFCKAQVALSLMMVVGGALLLLNLFGIFRLRREIHFTVKEKI